MKFSMIKPKNIPGRTKWRPPLGEMYKTNFDGVVFAESREARIGVVIRNSNGEVVAALSEKIPYPDSMEVLEVLAVRRAAQFAVEVGICQSVFEGDSEVVCKALKAADGGHPSIGQFVKDFLSTMSSLRTFSFSHTRRQGNSVAHTLAKKARGSLPLLVWMELVPSDIYEFVVSDFVSA